MTEGIMRMQNGFANATLSPEARRVLQLVEALLYRVELSEELDNDTEKIQIQRIPVHTIPQYQRAVRQINKVFNELKPEPQDFPATGEPTTQSRKALYFEAETDFTQPDKYFIEPNIPFPRAFYLQAVKNRILRAGVNRHLPGGFIREERLFPLDPVRSLTGMLDLLQPEAIQGGDQQTLSLPLPKNHMHQTAVLKRAFDRLKKLAGALGDETTQFNDVYIQTSKTGEIIIRADNMEAALERMKKAIRTDAIRDALSNSYGGSALNMLKQDVASLNAVYLAMKGITSPAQSR